MPNLFQPAALSAATKHNRSTTWSWEIHNSYRVKLGPINVRKSSWWPALGFSSDHTQPTMNIHDKLTWCLKRSSATNMIDLPSAICTAGSDNSIYRYICFSKKCAASRSQHVFVCVWLLLQGKHVFTGSVWNTTKPLSPRCHTSLGSPVDLYWTTWSCTKPLKVV